MSKVEKKNNREGSYCWIGKLQRVVTWPLFSFRKITGSNFMRTGNRKSMEKLVRLSMSFPKPFNSEISWWFQKWKWKEDCVEKVAGSEIPRLAPVHVFFSRFDCFIVLSAFDVIGQLRKRYFWYDDSRSETTLSIFHQRNLKFVNHISLSLLCSKIT